MSIHHDYSVSWSPPQSLKGFKIDAQDLKKYPAFELHPPRISEAHGGASISWLDRPLKGADGRVLLGFQSVQTREQAAALGADADTLSFVERVQEQRQYARTQLAQFAERVLSFDETLRYFEAQDARLVDTVVRDYRGQIMAVLYQDGSVFSRLNEFDTREFGEGPTRLAAMREALQQKFPHLKIEQFSGRTDAPSAKQIRLEDHAWHLKEYGYVRFIDARESAWVLWQAQREVLSMMKMMADTSQSVAIPVYATKAAAVQTPAPTSTPELT